jgi:phosphoglycolate phosphatase
MQIQKAVLWDWNGTLLDDTEICISAINLLLRDRCKQEIDRDTYREIFTFPVKDYYLSAGFEFDKEPFEKPALEFIEHYGYMVKKAALFSDVEEALADFMKRGYHQFILSAMEQSSLDGLVDHHGIRHYFARVSGIDDHYAHGKVDAAKALIRSLSGKADDIVMVGDTIHDHEVGLELDIPVVLVARGHQSEERLRTTGRRVARDLAEVRQLL